MNSDPLETIPEPLNELNQPSNELNQHQKEEIEEKNEETFLNDNKEIDSEEKEEKDEYQNMQKIDIPAYEKKLGNEKYRENEFIEAIKHYSKALLGLQFLVKDNMIDNEDTMANLIKDIEIPCNLNLAQCYNKIKEYKTSIKHSSKVLEIDVDNIKALYRRGISYIYLQEFDCARDDLKKALELDPENSEVNSSLNLLKQEKNKFNEKMRKMSEKMINSLDYSEKMINNNSENTTESSLFEKIISYPKKIFFSTTYHLKMLYLIPLGFISERCCKKRLPLSFYKKNT